ADAQTYLKSIWSLQEWSDAAVTPTKIADRAGVAVSTASGAITRLSNLGLVRSGRYEAVVLTDLGSRYALTMVRRHRLLETFLVQTLGYRWDQVHDEAEVLEHSASDFMIQRIDARLWRPSPVPPADPIRDPDGNDHDPQARPLPQIEPGQAIVVERISDADPGLLRYFTELGLYVGAAAEVRAGTPYSDALHVWLSDA